MNVYDFDGTLYNGDSTIDFYLYCLRKHPRIFCYMFRQIGGLFLGMVGKIDTTTKKEIFFSFLNGLQDIDKLVESFWDVHWSKIRRWYWDRKQKTDLVISASPEFLLVPVCSRLGIQPPIATRIDPQSGELYGQNCKGKEKVIRFLEQFPEENIQKFYSDSETDAPLAELAKAAFFVRGDKIFSWTDRAEEIL